MKLSTRLKNLREDKNIKQKDLALYLDVSSSTIGKYEVGKREPNIEKLNKIADYFNVSIDYLVGRTEKKMPYSVKNYFQEDIDELKETFDLSKEQIQSIKFSQLESFIEKEFGEEIPVLEELKTKLYEDDNFQLEDYTDDELRKTINLLSSSDDIKLSESLFNNNKIKNQIKSSITKRSELEKLHKIPLYNELSHPKISENEISSYINAPTFEIQNKDYFYLKAPDNSMIKFGIETGDILLIRKQKNNKHSNIGLIWIKSKEKFVIRSIIKTESINYIVKSKKPKLNIDVYKHDEIEFVGEVVEIRKEI